MATSATTAIDPATAATAYTKKYTDDKQALITLQTKRAAETAKALTTLSTAITTYQDSLAAISTQKTMLAQTALFSDSTLGSASAGVNAVSGTYSFFVEAVATNHQVSLSGLGANTTPTAGQGNLKITLANNSTFTVDLSTADKDNIGGVSVKEIAAAINAEPHNNSMVTASVITIAGVEQLVLTSGTSGDEGAITLDASNITDPSLQSFLAAPPKTMVGAQDAVIWLGAKPSDPLDTSNRIKQSSNVFTAVDGVTMTFTKAQAPGATPMTLTVATDDTATTANVQSFVDSYNKLKAVLDKLTDPGDPQSGVDPGAFSADSGVRVLRDQITRTLRESNVGTLATYGITAQKDGTLGLNATRLASALKANPAGLDAAIGSSADGKSSGVAGKLDTYLDRWSKASNGNLANRKADSDKAQEVLTKRQSKFEDDYVSLYNRYLKQFTTLQVLQSQMAQNTSLFDALFGSDSSSS